MVSTSYDAITRPIPMIGNDISNKPTPSISNVSVIGMSINSITIIVTMNRIRHADPVKNANAFMSSFLSIRLLHRRLLFVFVRELRLVA